MGSLFGSALSMLGAGGGSSSPTSSASSIGATNVNFGGDTSGAWWLLGGLALAGVGFVIIRKVVK